MTNHNFRHSNLIAAGILASRIAGIVRQVVMAAVIGGNELVTDAFNFAIRIPNLMQNLLGEGSLSASFIPVYAKLIEQDRREEANALAAAVLTLLSLVTASIVTLGILLAGPLVSLTNLDQDPEVFDLATQLTRITTLGIGFLVISAWCLGILNSHRNFFVSYVAPVVWNGFQIAALALGALLAWTSVDTATAMAWAVVAGSIAQVLIQLPRVRHLVPALKLNLNPSEHLKQVIARFGPAVGSRGVLQVSSFADLFMAASLVSGALSWYGYAQPLYITPISLFGFSVAVAELTEMSRSSGSSDAIIARLRPALRRVGVPAAFVSAAYLAAGPLLIDALYGFISRLSERGFQGPAQITTTGLLLSAFALGLPATMTARVSQNTLYALGDVKGPARIAAIRVGVSIVLSLILIHQFDWLGFGPSSGSGLDAVEIVAYGNFPHWPLFESVDNAQGPHLGVIGLGLGSSIAAWVEWVLLRARLRARLGRSISSGWVRPLSMAAIACWACMASAVQIFGIPTYLPAPLDAAVVLLAGFTSFVGVLKLAGISLRELR